MSGLRVTRGIVDALGSCNGCIRQNLSGFVYSIRGDGRTLEFRLCPKCVAELKAATPNFRPTGNKEGIA